MKDDFKLGMIIGSIALVGVLVWLATQRNVSTEARLARNHERQLAEQDQNTPPLPSSPTTVDTPSEIVTEQSPQLDSPTLQADPEPERPKVVTNKLHVVKRGETLSDISALHYGTSTKWEKIIEANIDVLTDPHKIRPGMMLKIPND